MHGSPLEVSATRWPISANSETCPRQNRVEFGMPPKASPWSFVLAFRRHWFAAMGGGFSVPFTALAVFSNSKYAQGIFASLAFSATWFAAYRVWTVEREKVIDLEAKLGPIKIREIEAQEAHAMELRRHAEALERQYTPPVIENMIEAMRQKGRVALGLERDPNALKILVENTPEFEQVQPRGDYVIRTVIACVENKDTSHFISNCKFSITFNTVDYLLVDSFTLNPTERRFIPIATHHETEVDKFIHVAIPRMGGFFAEAYQLRLPLSGALITLKATGAEARPAQQVCRIFVDESGKLKMEKA
jgi:hypothetical protein